jgi:CRP/FNR family transcriptional regulator
MTAAERCKYCLNEACVFLNISRQDLSFHPHDFTQLLEYEPGQTLYAQGAPLYGYSIICEGAVKLVRRLKEGKKLIVAVLGPGDILGLAATRQGHFALEAEALEKTRVGFIDKKDFTGLLERYPRLAAALVQKLSDEVAQLQERLFATARQGARSKLAYLLLQLAETHGRKHPQGVLIDVELTQSELAEMAGISRETASLALSQFKSRGLIAFEGRKLLIRDKVGLEALF